MVMRSISGERTAETLRRHAKERSIDALLEPNAGPKGRMDSLLWRINSLIVANRFPVAIELFPCSPAQEFAASHLANT
jgi:hypothetical protein